MSSSVPRLSIKQPYCPCKDCKERQTGCHATCKGYEAYTKEKSERYRAIHKYMHQEHEVNDVLIKGAMRVEKQHRRSYK